MRVELGEEETCFALKTVTQLPLSKKELPACAQKLICQLLSSRGENTTKYRTLCCYFCFPALLKLRAVDGEVLVAFQRASLSQGSLTAGH